MENRRKSANGETATGGLRWGIVGTGSIARAFATGLAASRTGRLAAVGSRSEGQAKRFVSESPGVLAHGSYAGLFGDPDVDAVYIATPHPSHAELAIQAAEAGKHVLCEKPAALNVWQAMAAVEAAREADVFFMEAFMYRCHPQTAKIRELVAGGALGEVRLIEAAFAFRARFDPASRLFSNALGGGGILDVGCYPVSFARMVAGAVDGLDFLDPLAVVGSAGVGAESRVDEWASANLRFPNGVQANVFAAVSVRHENRARIFGTEGVLEVEEPWIPSRDGGQVTMRLRRYDRGEPDVVSTGLPEAPRALYAAEADAVARSLAAREAPEMRHADTLGNMRALDAWRRSAGFQYDEETKLPVPDPVRRAPLSRRARAVHPLGEIAGLAKPVSRLVMGVDNQTSPAQAAAMFDDYFERGGNAFDTAWVYWMGKMETMLGRWLKARGVRDSVVIIAKGAHTPFCDPASFKEQFHQSLDRLGVDRVEIYLLHRDNPDIPAAEFVDALDEEVRAGRIGLVGGSNWTPARIDEANRHAAAAGRQPFTVLSNQFSLARMVDPIWKGCISASDPASRAWLTARGITLLPWSSQARGFFVGDVDASNPRDPEMARCWFSDDNFERRWRAADLARRLGVEPIHIALAFVLAQPFAAHPLIGPRSIGETASSFSALDVALTPAQVEWLDLGRDSDV